MLVVPSAAGTTHAAGVGTTWVATSAPFRLTFLSGGRTVAAETTLSGGPGGRLSYRLANGSFHGLGNVISTTRTPSGAKYVVATDEPARTATVVVTRTRIGLNVSFTLIPSTEVIGVFEAFVGHANEHYLGGGERPAALDLRGQSRVIKVAYSCANVMPSPFFLSSAGYGVLLRTTVPAAMAFPGATLADSCTGGAESRCPLVTGYDIAQVCAKAASLTYTIFTGTPEQIVSSYTAAIGRPMLPPISQFALIKWRDSVSGEAQVYEDVDKLHALRIPIGWVLLDNPWETGLCYGTMTFDSERFPNPAAMIAAIHARGVEFMLWISPLVRLQFCPPSTLYSQSALFMGGNAATIDLTDPSALATFKSKVKALLTLGVDGFKGDRADEIDLEPFELAGGPGVTLHNEYPLLYERAVAAVVRAAGKSASFASIFQAGAPGSIATVPGFWGGDQPGTFAGLQDAIHDGLSASVAGYSTWGSDTGGYSSVGLTSNTFIRWAEFSAVTPVFEVGGVGENATFWNFGTPTVNAFREAAVLHYELFPYLYGLTTEAHATGVPVLRPLALEYPGDPEAWKEDLEVLVGHDLLAAPVAVAGTKASVYLPGGTWVDLGTGASRPGGGLPFVRPTPLAQLPLYLRAGAAIPFAAREPRIWPTVWPVDALQLPGRGGWLYAPAQGTTSAKSTDFGTFRASDKGSVATITLTGAPRQTQLLVAGAHTPRAVRLGDRTVARSRSVAELRGESSGWAATRTPFPGVVVKVSPHAGSAQIKLAY